MAITVGCILISVPLLTGAATRSDAVVGQAAVSGTAHRVTKGEPERTASDTCPHARRGLAWYRLRHRQWTVKRGASVSGHRRPARNCADARYLADLWTSRSFAARRAYERWWLRVTTDPDAAIMYVFGPVYGPGAKHVAACESGDRDGDLSPHVVGATNGQYLGMFQMGSYARAAFGHSSRVLGQVLAAHRYFVASGSDWSQWPCQP